MCVGSVVKLAAQKTTVGVGGRSGGEFFAIACFYKELVGLRADGRLAYSHSVDECIGKVQRLVGAGAVDVGEFGYAFAR